MMPSSLGAKWLHNGCGAEVIPVVAMAKTRASAVTSWHCIKCGPVPPASVRAASPKCDFCSDPKPEFALACGDFRVPGLLEQGSAGEWYACGACAEFIRNGDWPGLLRRVSRILARKLPGGDRKQIRADLSLVYAELRRRAGALTPLAGKEVTS